MGIFDKKLFDFLYWSAILWMLLKRPCVQIIISMGNVEVHDLAPVRADERKELNLSRRVNYKQYLKVGSVYHKLVSVCVQITLP